MPIKIKDLLLGKRIALDLRSGTGTGRYMHKCTIAAAARSRKNGGNRSHEDEPNEPNV
jgi:hypothetical protein